MSPRVEIGKVEIVGKVDVDKEKGEIPWMKKGYRVMARAWVSTQAFTIPEIFQIVILCTDKIFDNFSIT